MKKKAYTFHHTHWDAEWYFTEQHSQIQFVYHMNELFEALDKGLIDNYHMDGKSSCMEDYFETCPQDKEKFNKYVKEGKIVVGPLYEQLSSFIAPGESVIKNLQIGMRLADEYGGTSKVAYIPDSFGQIQDFPKIFNGVGIKDFVFRRGMGDVHELKNDFLWKSNDDSEILTTVLQAGYSFAGLAFLKGRLIANAGLNLDKKGIIDLMHACSDNSSVEGQFLFPAGKDNCPVMMNFKELMEKYNNESEDFEFIETTLEDYMNLLRKSDTDFQVYEGEFYTTQYHRVHKSIFSARPDIKIVQDNLERLLIFELQPLMTILDNLCIPYENGTVDKIWKLLIRSQTHSEATNSDEVNEQILARATRGLIYAESVKEYLTRKISVSVPKVENAHAIVVFNTLPFTETKDLKINVYSKNKKFKLMLNGKELDYSIITQDKVYGGWRRKHRELLDSGRDYFLTTIGVTVEEFKGLSYETIYLHEDTMPTCVENANLSSTYIENDRIRVELFQGGISIRDKVSGKFIEDAIYFENSGDQGDTFDYDFPDNDMILTSSFENAKVTSSFETKTVSEMTLEGTILIPKDLISRKNQTIDATIPYTLTLRVCKNSSIVELSGKIKNTALNHRMRLVLKTNIESKESVAGTQFSYLKRDVNPKELNDWIKDKWLEEPATIEPILNHASLVGKDYTYSVFTKSAKEYQVIGEKFTDIALTLYRSVGHFGLPDLNRRPGRASGIPECIMECPISQMMDKEITFHYGLSIYEKFDGNDIHKKYTKFAVNPVYFQDQEYDRVFTPMKYFEVNSLSKEIPTSFNLFQIENSDCQFSTLEKSSKDNAYILRLFNNENHDIDGGKITFNMKVSKIEIVNLREEFISEGTEIIGNMKKGELRTIKIYL